MIVCICQIMQCIMLFTLFSQIRQPSPYTSCRSLSAASPWFYKFTAQCHLHTFHSPVPSVGPICNNLFTSIIKITFCACLSIFCLDTHVYVYFVLSCVTPSLFPICLSLSFFLCCCLPPVSLSYHLSVTLLQCEFKIAFLRSEQIKPASGHGSKWLWTRRKQKNAEGRAAEEFSTIKQLLCGLQWYSWFYSSCSRKWYVPVLTISI